MLFSISPSDRCGSGKTPLPQCAFKVSMFNVSAIHINSRSWLRSSSTHEPSDPPLRIVDLGGQIFRKFKGVGAERRAQVPRRCERPTRTRFTVRLSLTRPGQRQWHPGLPSDSPSPFSLNVPLALITAWLRFYLGVPLQRAGYLPSRRQVYVPKRSGPSFERELWFSAPTRILASQLPRSKTKPQNALC
jgi:hypothetical protein